MSSLNNSGANYPRRCFDKGAMTTRIYKDSKDSRATRVQEQQGFKNSKDSRIVRIKGQQGFKDNKDSKTARI